MDFSTVDRALASLSRRRPLLPPESISISNRLSELLRDAEKNDATNDGGGGIADSAEYVSLTLKLIRWGEQEVAEGSTTERWEPSAVGMLLAADYLEHRASELLEERRSKDKSAGNNDEGCDSDDDGDDDEGTGLGTGGGGVYADGPRIPQTRAVARASNPGVAPPTSAPPVTVGVAPSSAVPPVRRRNPHVWRPDSPAFALLAALPSLVEARVEHREPRVRSLVARVVGAHARLVTSLADLGGGEEELRAAVASAQLGRRSVHSSILRSLQSHLAMKEPSRSENPSKASDGALDDTTGWRALETNLHALAAYIDGCVGRGVGSYPVEEMQLLALEGAEEAGDDGRWFLEGLTHCCVVHVNRHVRAAAAAVLGTIVKVCMKCENDVAARLLVDFDSPLRNTLKASLKANLQDNWSQVCMAGSVLCRRYVRSVLRIRRRQEKEEGANNGEEDGEESTLFEDAIGSDLVPILLPRMCLNRFYLAQGVKLYSQDTWRIIFSAAAGATETAPRGGGGVGAVARCAAPVCRYYSKMCDADNHAVREAACQGVAELAQKIGRHPEFAECLAPYVPTLLQALLMCFHDESWPVRDEACLACGTFVLAYPDECHSELSVLFERWTEQLTDQIWSVREDAAVALGDAVAAYGSDMLEKIMAVLRKSLPAARDQPPMSRDEYRRLQNDMAAHTDNQLYSCGSLAPKLRKGGAGRIGCGNCDVNRPKAPWEASDGCVYLLRELCDRFYDGGDGVGPGVGGGAGGDGQAVPTFGDDVLLPILTELADISRLSHYPQSDDLRTTIWRQLPAVARGVGKKRFKRSYLNLFLGELAKNLENRGGAASQLSVHAAGQCSEELAAFVGPGIFRGRFEEDWMGEAYDKAMEERGRGRSERHAAMGAGGSGQFLGAEEFSPFGPPPIKS